MGAVTVHVTHKFLQAVLGVEHLLAGLALGIGAKVGKRNADACVEEGQLTHTAGHDVPLECGRGKDGGLP